MIKSVWISCSNRSEYGLIRPLLKEMTERAEYEYVLRGTLILYSDALNNCSEDAFRDFKKSSIEIVQWRETKIKKDESLNEHFGRLVYGFSRNDFFKCDLLMVAGDRYESFALEQSAFYQRIPIAHLFGGDISNGGHFDDHVRHAMSHLASVHFPVNKTAYDNLIAMKQEESRVFLVGSPVVDDMVCITQTSGGESICDVLISFNPMTLQASNAVARDLRLTLEALELIQSQMKLRCLATCPNHEPGVQELLDVYNEFEGKEWFQLVESLGSPKYLYAIKESKIVVGNSSSQVLEVPLLGQRCLLIGDRQKGRHRPASVVHVPCVADAFFIKNTILGMLKSEAPAPCEDYGVPGVSRKIVEVVGQLNNLPRNILVQKNNPLPNLDEANIA
ncbi:MAG: hypothetical protein C0613_01565 [Desulfobulbaceae bacterium]|nr:MAG: hypothetical protein C0613_01565 [Desulfobulbaceae bacterium]